MLSYGQVIDITAAMILPPVYPITDTKISGLSHTEQVRRLIEGGATFIQLREKYLPAWEFFEDAREAVAFGKDNGAVILINDRVDIAAAVGAHGVHVGQNDLLPADARAILGSNAIIGYSTHSIEQAEAALKEPVDYIAIGPVFATTTKDDSDAVLGIEGLRTICSFLDEFVTVAIGGINHSNISEILRAGVDSAAVVSAVLKDPTRISDQVRHLSKAAGASVIQR